MLELVIVVALIVLNGFFAMSEMALMTSRKLRLKQMSETSRGAAKALALAEHPDNLLSTVQVGITGGTGVRSERLTQPLSASAAEASKTTCDLMTKPPEAGQNGFAKPAGGGTTANRAPGSGPK